MMVRGSGLGFHFSIETPDEILGTFFERGLRHLPADGDWHGSTATEIRLRRADGDVTVLVDDRDVYTGAASAALARAMNVVNVGATRAAGTDPVLHCAVVTLRDRAILLPGRPGAGKSTTTAALLLRGLGYASDEAAPVTVDLRIRPYPKPVVIGRGSRSAVAGAERAVVELGEEALDAWWLDPELLGCPVASDPLPVGAVIAPQYRAGAALSIEELSRAEATAVLASNTFNMHEHGIAGVERTAAMTDGIPLFRATFGDVEELCDVLLSQVVM